MEMSYLRSACGVSRMDGMSNESVYEWTEEGRQKERKREWEKGRKEEGKKERKGRRIERKSEHG